MQPLKLLVTLGLAAGTTDAISTLVDLGHAKYQGVALSNGVNQWLGVRFAAPCTGTNRFRAPQPPIPQTAVQDASRNGPICVSANKQEDLPHMGEDCLFLGIFAPANATPESKLPIMFFIGGGGFNSNANSNFNGSGLVEASGMGMVVVRTNYRVGILGFVGGTAVQAAHMAAGRTASPNNGFRDMIAAAQFVKQHAKAFGGDPDHIVVSGDSSGAEAISLLLTSNNGTGWPDLFKGAAVESVGLYGSPPPEGRDKEFLANVNATQCANATEGPIECMRKMPIAKLQYMMTSDGWGPVVDNEISMAPPWLMWEQGRFQKIPVIFGATSTEGTPDYISNQSVSTEQELFGAVRGSLPSVVATNDTMARMVQAYPDSLNKVNFFGVNVAPQPNAVSLRKGTGAQWQRDAAVKTELKVACTAMFMSDMKAAGGIDVNSNWHYRWNVIDPLMAEQGLFSPHTQELYGIWGSNMTDGGDPPCLANGGDCKNAIRITQGYWISFVKTLDPNKLKAADAPTWEPWSIKSPRRIVLSNQNAAMETVGTEPNAFAGLNQRTRCVGLMTPLARSVAIGTNADGTLAPFANGTRADPTLAVLGGKTAAAGTMAESMPMTDGGGTVLPRGSVIMYSAFLVCSILYILL